MSSLLGAAIAVGAGIGVVIFAITGEAFWIVPSFNDQSRRPLARSWASRFAPLSTTYSR